MARTISSGSRGVQPKAARLRPCQTAATSGAGVGRRRAATPRRPPQTRIGMLQRCSEQAVGEAPRSKRMLVLWGRLGSVPIPRLPSRVQGAQPPPGGTGGVPLFWKTSEGGAGGIAAQATTRPSPEGGRWPQQDPPSRLCHPPLQNTNGCAMVPPMKWATSPLLFLGACRIHEYWGLTMESPPVAGALREQPKGQDRPRKAGTGENAAVRHRLFRSRPTP